MICTSRQKATKDVQGDFYTNKTGALHRRRHATEITYHAQRPWNRKAYRASVMQPLAVLHDQGRKGSCRQQADGQGIESITGQRVSCVDLWEGARILGGTGDDADAGTYGEDSIQWLETYGWGDYVQGEDYRSRSEDIDRRVSSVSAAVRAWSRRNRIVHAKTINLRQGTEDIVEAVIAALQTPKHYVVLEGGCQTSYFNPPDDVVLGPEYRAGATRGHAERIAGYSADRDAFLIQGSWGAWTCCRLPCGQMVAGCCWVSPEVLAEAWAVDVVEVITQ